MFSYNVQFGHAGACANAQRETADDKNKALRLAGAIVPESFDRIGQTINDVYCSLLEKGILTMKVEMPAPVLPVDYAWANKLGLIRKPAAFISSISDERGEELKYVTHIYIYTYNYIKALLIHILTSSLLSHYD